MQRFTEIFPHSLKHCPHSFKQMISPLSLKSLDILTNKPANIQHGLEQVLRRSGIYKVNQFASYEFLSNIPKAEDHILKRLSNYQPPSLDEHFQKVAISCPQKINLIAASSSMTEAMTHAFWAVTNFKSPDLRGLNKYFNTRQATYMLSYRKPTLICVRKIKFLDNKVIYAIDGDDGILNKSNVLASYGVILEAMLTSKEEEFKKLIDKNEQFTEKQLEQIRESQKSHRFTIADDLLIRSQIDGEAVKNGERFVYEIKTRAVAPIRYDMPNYLNYLDYEIQTRVGKSQSYELENYDIIRSVLPKFFFQMKFGRMDGYFVAYHNTAKIFGFQYVTLEEVQKRLFGNGYLAERSIEFCTGIFKKVIQDVLEEFDHPDQVRLGFYSSQFTKDLIITAECFDQTFQWVQEETIDSDIEDDYDYAMKTTPNKYIYVWAYSFLCEVNGIKHQDPLVVLEGDQLKIYYKKQRIGYLNPFEYSIFMREASKLDGFINSRDFAGIWKKDNDFHLYEY